MPGLSRRFAIVIAVVGLLVAPAVASADTNLVTNGDFETGNLTGWTHADAPNSPFDGSWFIYSGTTAPLSDFPVVAPPQGDFAVVADQGGPGRRILYQDVALPAGATKIQLSLLLYYRTQVPIVEQDNLDFSGPPPANEQYRIDVMKPSAPLDSVAAGDILTSVFNTPTGSVMTVAPTERVVDLTPYAGQTVRLRLAEADNEGVFNASVDAISITAHTNAFTIGNLTKDKKKGTALIPVTSPEPGTFQLTGWGIVQSTVPVGAGTTNLLVKTTGKKKKKLKKNGKAKVSPFVTFAPEGLPGHTEQLNINLKKKRKKK
jgi:hypothetical protein